MEGLCLLGLVGEEGREIEKWGMANCGVAAVVKVRTGLTGASEKKRKGGRL